MRHPRLLFPASLLTLALAACGAPYDDTASASGSSTGGTTGEPEPTTSTTGEPVAPELPTNRYFLRIDDTPPAPVRLEMDKAKALEIFGETAARQIKLIDVPTDKLLPVVLDRIQNSCGTGWRTYNPALAEKFLPESANHNCDTELGKTYGATEAERKLSPQYAMVRLLTMTSRNGNVANTALGSLWTYFHRPENGNNAFGLSFEDILAASLFCPYDANDPTVAADCVKQLKSFEQQDNPQYKNLEKDLQTKPFIPLDVLADTLKVTLMSSHPNIANETGALPVSLYDALLDMAPLADKFGPAGDHPGLLMKDDSDGDGVPEFTTRSDALQPDFKMVAIAESNLRRVIGVDASSGAGEMFVSTAAAPLAFNFLDEQKVQFVGIAEAPTVDMRMRIMELPERVPSCVDEADCKQNAPGDSSGIQYIWSQEPWSLERIVATAAYETYKEREFEFCFIIGDPCDALVKIGAGNDPPGWSVFDVKVGATAPKPQFFWELLLDIAQTAVHDFTGPDTKDVDKDGNTLEVLPAANGEDDIKEGDANPVFALSKVPIGLSRDEMLALIRPTLQAQADVIADVILGNYWKNNGRLDFYYRLGDDGKPYLFFVAASDKRPAAGDPDQLDNATYPNPGFFADAALTQKVSTTNIPGVSDTEHEKFPLPDQPTTLYMQDDTGTVYQLSFNVLSTLEVVVTVDAL